MQGIEQAKKQAAEEIWLSYFQRAGVCGGTDRRENAEQDSGGTGAG